MTYSLLTSCNGSDQESTQRYRVASILKLKGFGASVLAKLIETKLKSNLYYEIKDRVIEETNDGIRIVRKKQKTKVYGLDSSKNKRDLLIQILRERMESHKDKFVSPVIYDELKKMEVKRSGKVEHSDNSHDDQVFSYLMAMYVWYEGKDLKERFGIEKTTIKTDEDIDEVVTGLDEADQTGIVTEIENIQSSNEEIDKTIKALQAGAGIMFSEFMKREREFDQQSFQLLLQNPAAKASYAQAHNMTEEEVDAIYGNSKKAIPDSALTDFYKNDYDDMDSFNKHSRDLAEKFKQRSQLR